MSRTIVITGSGSGMGLATAELLRERGDRVIGVDLNNVDVIADLSTEAGCAKMVKDVTALAGGHVDAVIANAGVLGPDALCYAVNYHGAVRTLEGLRPLLARSSAPRAVVTASYAASTGALSMAKALELGENPTGASPRETAYAASKLAIARWIRRSASSVEWAQAGILLNAVCPGLVDTPMQSEAMKMPSVSALVETVPLRRLARPRELAEVFAFLVGEANSFITGQLLYVDGGLEAASRPEMV
jgi:NAD(P)-dependent dehydrogenase (short-subunit alcohol dehydrogenase family)